ncbi:MAG: LamG domain-containing protein [Candidatus Sifarchaeia archaeon]
MDQLYCGHPAPGSPVGSAVLHLKFDEGYGDVANDSSPQNNDGDLSGSGVTCPGGAATCPVWTDSGKIGKALDFNQTDRDYVQVTGLLGTPTNITLSARVNLDSTDSNGAEVISLGDLVAIRAYTQLGVVGFYHHGSSNWHRIDSGENIAGTGWHHIVYTIDDTNDRQYLYIDGALKVTTINTESIDYSGQGSNTFIGRHGNGVVNSDLDGRIDEVKVYNFALTADQVKVEYNQGKAQVLGSLSTDSSLAPSSSSLDSYCPPGQGSTCTAPVAEWKFDESSGTSAFDTSENNNTGTLTNGPVWTPKGRDSSWALDFNGSDGDDVVSVSSDTSIDNIFDSGGSVEAWIYPLNTLSDADVDRLFFKGNPWDVRFESTSGGTADLMLTKDFTGDDGSWITVSEEITYNNWSHVVVTYDNDSDSYDPIFYVNGKKVEITEQVPAPSGTRNSDAGQALYIGNNNSSVAGFTGTIDNVRFYNYIRTPSQIAWSYNRGAPVGWWKFDECSGTTAYDSGSGGNNGTIAPGGAPNTSAGTCSSGDNTEMWDDGTTGKINASLGFDNTDDTVTVPNDASINDLDTLTLTAWFYANGWGENNAGRIFYKPDAFDILLTSDGQFIFNAERWTNDGTWITPQNTLTLGQWYHIAVTYDYSSTSNDPSFYVNGKPVVVIQTSAPSGGPNSESADLEIGNTSGLGRTFDGQIDDVRIYNYALTQQQINDVYNSGAVRFGP